jgi:hypothetical protein
MVLRISISTTAAVKPPSVLGKPVAASVASTMVLRAGGSEPCSPDTASSAGNMALMEMISASDASTKHVSTIHGFVPLALKNILKILSISCPLAGRPPIGSKVSEVREPCPND